MAACGVGAESGALGSELQHNALNMTPVLSGRKGRDKRKRGDARCECDVAPLVASCRRPCFSADLLLKNVAVVCPPSSWSRKKKHSRRPVQKRRLLCSSGTLGAR